MLDVRRYLGVQACDRRDMFQEALGLALHTGVVVQMTSFSPLLFYITRYVLAIRISKSQILHLSIYIYISVIRILTVL